MGEKFKMEKNIYILAFSMSVFVKQCNWRDPGLWKGLKNPALKIFL